MASALSHRGLIIKLRSEYISKAIYSSERNSIHGEGDIDYSGFFGSENSLFLGSKKGSINLEAPACIAAPIVTIVAKGAITLGMKGKRGELVQLYSPDTLSFTATHLSVGDIKLMTIPTMAYISCKKLTLAKSSVEDPDHFEVVKSWVVKDDAEIEKVRFIRDLVKV